MPLEIDQPGRVDGGVVPLGSQERRLVDAQLPHRPDPVGVIDERGAVVGDGVRDRPPTHPELIGQLGDGTGILTNLAARLDASAAGQHDLRVDMLRGLGPRPRRAPQLPTTPPPLDPPQPSRPPKARQIPDVDRHPILRLGACPAPPTVRPHRRRLDRDDHLDVVVDDVEDRNPGSPNSTSARPIPSLIVRGLLHAAAVR